MYFFCVLFSLGGFREVGLTMVIKIRVDSFCCWAARSANQSASIGAAAHRKKRPPTQAAGSWRSALCTADFAFHEGAASASAAVFDSETSHRMEQLEEP